MSFWLHNSFFTLVLKRFSPSTRVIITVFFLGSFAGCWAYFFYIPLQASFAQGDKEIKKLNEMIVLFKKELLTKISNQQVANVKKTYQTCLEQHHSLQDTVDFILTSLKECKLTCKGLQPIELPAKESSQYASFNLSIKGNFKKIILFLTYLQESEHLVSFTTLTLQRDTRRRVKLEALIQIPIKVIS